MIRQTARTDQRHEQTDGKNRHTTRTDRQTARTYIQTTRTDRRQRLPCLRGYTAPTMLSPPPVTKRARSYSHSYTRYTRAVGHTNNNNIFLPPTLPTASSLTRKPAHPRQKIPRRRSTIASTAAVAELRRRRPWRASDGRNHRWRDGYPADAVTRCRVAPVKGGVHDALTRE